MNGIDFIQQRLDSYKDFAAARADVLPFVHPFERPSLDLWSREFFAGLVDRI